MLCRVSGVRHSAKIIAVSCRRLLTVLCRVQLFTECKDFFAVYLCAESLALGKHGHYREQDFAECPTKNTRQSAKHSAKIQIPTVQVR
jgi:hypothetical protein